jgi:hypothetical protein
MTSMAHEKCTKKFKLEEFPVISEDNKDVPSNLTVP